MRAVLLALFWGTVASLCLAEAPDKSVPTTKPLVAPPTPVQLTLTPRKAFTPTTRKGYWNIDVVDDFTLPATKTLTFSGAGRNLHVQDDWSRLFKRGFSAIDKSRMVPDEFRGPAYPKPAGWKSRLTQEQRTWVVYAGYFTGSPFNIQWAVNSDLADQTYYRRTDGNPSSIYQAMSEFSGSCNYFGDCAPGKSLSTYGHIFLDVENDGISDAKKQEQANLYVYTIKLLKEFSSPTTDIGWINPIPRNGFGYSRSKDWTYPATWLWNMPVQHTATSRERGMPDDIVGKSYSDIIDIQMPGCYFYYPDFDYTIDHKGDETRHWLAGVLHEQEINMKLSPKKRVAWQWLFNSINGTINNSGKSMHPAPPMVAEGTAIFYWFTGAYGAVLWDDWKDLKPDQPTPTDPRAQGIANDRVYACYEHYIHGLWRLFKHHGDMFDNKETYLNDQTECSYDGGKTWNRYNANQLKTRGLPFARAIVNRDQILIAATMPYAKPGQITNFKLRYRENGYLFYTDIQLNGDEIMLGRATMPVATGPDNDMPIPFNLPNVSGMVNQPFHLVMPTFSDPENQPLTYSFSGNVPGLTFNPATRVLSGTPTSTGSYTLTYTGTDPYGENGSSPLKVTIYSTPPPNTTGGFDGHIDIADCSLGFKGWVWNRLTPNDAVVVDILDNKKLVASAIVSDYREDLKALGNGKHGFLFPIPDFLRDNLTHTITAKVQGTDWYLKSGPKYFKCAPSTAPTPNTPPVAPTVAAASGQVTKAFSLVLPPFTDAQNHALTYAVTGSVPGLNFNPSTRTLSGTPTQAGSYTLTYTATDTQGASNSTSVEISVAAAPPNGIPVPPTVSPLSATATVSFTTTLPVFTDPDGHSMTYSLTGSVPGLTFNAATRVLSGAPTQEGTYTLTYKATDSQNGVGQVDIEVTVAQAPPNTEPQAPTVSPLSATATVAFTTTLPVFTDAEGQPMTYAVTGSVPGLSFNASTRVLSGTPTQEGSYTLTYKATDNQNGVGSVDIEVTVAAAPPNDPPVAPTVASQTATVGQSFTTTLPVFTDPQNQTLTYAVTGSVPGLNFNASTRVLSGTPTTAGSYTLTYTATDPRGASASASVEVTVSEPKPNEAPVAPVLTAAGGQVNKAFTLVLPVFTDPEGQALTYSLTGSVPGLTFNRSTRTLGGTPTTPGAYSLTYSATDNQNATTSAALSVTIAPASTVSAIFDGHFDKATCENLGGWVWDKNQPNAALIVEIMENGKVVTTAVAGTYRSDLALMGNGQHGWLIPTPSILKDNAIHTLSVRVQGTTWNLKSGPRSINCVPDVNTPNTPPAPPTVSPLSAMATVSFSTTLPVFTDAENQALTYAVTGSVPGLSFNSATRALSGAPTQEGSYSLTYTATDTRGASGSVTVQMTVAPAPPNTNPAAPTVADANGQVGKSFSLVLPAFTDAENQPLTYSLNGSVPGLNFNASTRTLSGTPTTAGSYTLTYGAADNQGGTGSTTFGVTIAPPAPNVAPTAPTVAPLSATATVAYTTTLPVFTDPEGQTMTYAVTGSVPGLSFNTSNRVLSGTPTTAGSYTLTYTATDSQNGSTSTPVEVTVAPAPPNSPPVAPTVASASGQVGKGFSLVLPAFTDAPGQTLTYSLTGSVPGLSFNSSTRTLSGTPTQEGAFTLSYSAKDPENASASASFTVTITGAPTVTGNFDGYLDQANCSTLAGWAADKNKPTLPMIVEIVEGSTVVGTLVASDYRGALASIGGGFHGFTVPLPELLRDGKPHNITARIQGSAFTLKGGLKTVNCPAPNTGTVNPGGTNPPVAVTLPAARGQVGQPFALLLPAFRDADNQPLTYTLGGAVPGVSFNGSIRTLSGTPTQTGTFTLNYTATDPTNQSASATLTVTIAPAPVTAISTYDGHFDKADCSVVNGWVWDSKQPNTALNVEILDGSNYISTVVAGSYRGDLATKGNGQHAFSVPLPAQLKDGKPHVINLRVEGTIFYLKAGSIIINCASSARMSAAATPSAESTELETRISAWPNPTTGRVTVSFRLPAQQTARLSVADLMGRPVVERNVVGTGQTQEETLEIGQSTNGVHFILLKTESGTVGSKILLNR
ncbi:putative Ig domain-containing protein [Larkinella soli]|uniref:putative Ig domain-containing protein n=1 Tax=Larkinella soli TaxID=1770527 RepID=UPI000FFB474C|nr:putative Ig domain-containing protein [Larkinella soli]